MRIKGLNSGVVYGARVDSKSIMASEALGVGSIPTAVTIKRITMEVLYKEALEMVKLAIKLTEDHKMTNEQIFIDWLDDINKLSVKY